MALSNFGSAVSVYLGESLLMFLNINTSNYINLPYAILIKACCRLLPILLIPVLITLGSPSDHDSVETASAGGSSHHSLETESNTMNPILQQAKIELVTSDVEVSLSDVEKDFKDMLVVESHRNDVKS